MQHGVSQQPRLTLYLALAGGALSSSAALAGGGIIAQPSLDLMLDPQVSGDFEMGDVDFGPGFGELFNFSARFISGGFSNTTSIYSSWSRSAAVGFQSGQGWTQASVLNPYGLTQPGRLFAGSAIDGAATGWFAPGQLAFYFGYNLSFPKYGGGQSGQYYAGSWGDVTGIDREGFLGFRITNDGGANYLYGWFDVEYDQSDRSGKLTIRGWGLNTTPNAGIEAGQVPSPGPGALALLAAGAAGLRRTRRQG